MLSGENLPFDNASFDSVVSTWTLCSISNINQALSEVYRVLKPGGKFYYVEHGLSNEPKIQKWQNRLNPLQKRLLGGCHLNRDIQKLVEAHQFTPLSTNQHYAKGSAKIVGYFYQGVMLK